MNISSLNLSSIIVYGFTILYLTIIALIAGIDRKHIKIEKKILVSGIILSILYIIYLFVINSVSIYWNVAYLGIYIILLIIDTFLLRRYAKDSYIIKVLMLLDIILVFTGLQITIYTIIMATIAILIYILLLKIKKKKNGNKKIKFREIPLGYFIGACNMISLLIITFVTHYCI